MSASLRRSPPRLILVAGSALALLVLATWLVPQWIDWNRFRPYLESAGSRALGMPVRMAGRAGLTLLPSIALTARDAQVLDDAGAVVASVRRLRVGISLLPLLGGAVRVRRLDLVQPRIQIERSSDGRFNVAQLRQAAALLGALDRGTASISGGTVHFLDRRTGSSFEATDIAFTLTPRGGRFEVDPASMKLFGGEAKGSIRVDLSGARPAYEVRGALAGFRIEQFLGTLTSKPPAEGVMNLTASVSMHGEPDRSLLESLTGEISLRGENLELVGNDLDREIGRFESSQSFSLVDVGAVFLAGPIGLAVTKGYDLASLFRGSGGRSSIRTLVSDWKVERGVARATDVAMATSRNRIALTGGLDLANERFADVTIAVVDANGCARVRQAVHGTFAAPIVEKPHLLASISGPLLKLYRQTRALLPAGACDAFYSGSVAPPR
ncbi:MAG: AsmA family protein [Candidatus Eisenbacteria bacterium]|uniref:AsmA family protein n=1 Tax=Eiseniibacteriota bacterium TaxID=2212470 RepID=A0A849SB10_UNCEI|nr:AsmA family protein [Candidatus Eisenbacteria bacterium]